MYIRTVILGFWLTNWSLSTVRASIEHATGSNVGFSMMQRKAHKIAFRTSQRQATLPGIVSSRSTLDKAGDTTDASIATAPRVQSYREGLSPNRESLPAFAALTNDEDRERVAECSRPGTYTVIVNQESFSSMPEYASPPEGRRMSVQSMQSSLGSANSELGRSYVVQDPHTVVLTRFEDAVPSLPSFHSSTYDRRPSLQGDMHRLDIGSQAQPVTRPTPSRVDSVSQHGLHDQQLLQHYEQKISPRLFFLAQHNHGGEMQDPVLVEAQRYPPVCPSLLLGFHRDNMY